MIPQEFIIEWKENAPWQLDAQVEQDLLLSRSLIEIFSNPLIKNNLIFRGGTALHKFFFFGSRRYSEDLDLVQKNAEPIGPVINAIQAVLNPLFGKADVTRSFGRVKIIYRFDSEILPSQRMRVKIEINTREHYNFYDLQEIEHSIESGWFEGKAFIPLYSIEELLGTKLRALYQRKKGRDLFDLFIAQQEFPDLDYNKVIYCFKEYLKKDNLSVSRAEFEKNMLEKMEDVDFLEDMTPLLKDNHQYNILKAFEVVSEYYINRLPGAPLKTKLAQEFSIN